ncbi:MAG: carboxypeptidase-like regulatory domain-containing protein [Candidatus Korarchaeum sp.]
MRVVSLLLVALLVFPIQAKAEYLFFNPPSGTWITVYTNYTRYTHVIRIYALSPVSFNITSSLPINATSSVLLAGQTLNLGVSIDVPFYSSIYQNMTAILGIEGRALDTGENFTVNYIINVRFEAPKPPGSLLITPSPLMVTIERGKENSYPISITNNHNCDVTINGYTASSLVSGFSPIPTKIVQGGMWTFYVKVNAKTLNVGNYTDSMLITYGASGYSGVFTVSLPLKVTVVPPTTPPPPQPPSGSFFVNITVIDKMTGVAIEGARVVLISSDGGEIAGITGPSGLVSFQNVRAGSYTVLIVHIDYGQITSNILVNGNLSRVFLLEKPQSTTTTTTTTPSINVSGLGVVGLPYTSKNVEISPGKEITYYILMSAEGGELKGIKVIPTASIPNWITLGTNVTDLAAGRYAALTLRVSPPLDVPPGRYSRQFQILGGSQPAAFTVTVTVTNVTVQPQQTLQSVQPQITAITSVAAVIPRVLVRLENGTAVSTQIAASVQKGSLIYVVVQGEYNKVAFNLTGGLAVFADEAGAGKRTITLQANGDGDFLVYLLSRDEYGNLVKQQPSEYGYGVYRFRVIQSGPQKQVLLSVDQPMASVGKAVTIMAYLIVNSPGGYPVTQPFQGVVTVNTPEGPVPLPLGLEGRATYIPQKAGIYKLTIQGVPIAAESVTQFEARTTIIPYTMTDELKVNEAKTWRFPVPFQAPPVCWADPQDSVSAINCDSETVTFVPAKAGSIFTIHAKGLIAEPYDVYSSGTEIEFSLKPHAPVQDTIIAFVSRGSGYVMGWAYQNLFWILLASLIVFGLIYTRLRSPKRKFGSKSSLLGRFGG